MLYVRAGKELTLDTRELTRLVAMLLLPIPATGKGKWWTLDSQRRQTHKHSIQRHTTPFNSLPLLHYHTPHTVHTLELYSTTGFCTVHSCYVYTCVHLHVVGHAELKSS